MVVAQSGGLLDGLEGVMRLDQPFDTRSDHLIGWQSVDQSEQRQRLALGDRPASSNSTRKPPLYQGALLHQHRQYKQYVARTCMRPWSHTGRQGSGTFGLMANKYEIDVDGDHDMEDLSSNADIRGPGTESY